MYIYNRVGGSNGSDYKLENRSYYNKQDELIKDSFDHVNKINKDPEHGYSNYDPYRAYQTKKGLIPDPELPDKRRYKTAYINIDSKYRQISPSSTLSDTYLLDKNPMSFNNNNKKLLTIKQNNHPFQVGDLIEITNVVGKQSVLNTYDNFNQPTIDMPPGFNFVKIYFKHGVDLNYNGDLLLVDISNIKGDRGTIDSSSYLQNIPVNLINNKQHIVINICDQLYQSSLIKPIIEYCNQPLDPNASRLDYTKSNYYQPSPDYFFIIIPIAMDESSNMSDVNSRPYTLYPYNYRVKMLAVDGVPLSYINSSYPINQDHNSGYKTIISVGSNSYDVLLDIDNTSNTTSNFGGNSVNISKISSINSGYPNSNSYTISLGKTYHDVVSARLVSLEIPNSDYPIRSNTNNKLYWNDIDDGDYLYSITVPPGTYNPSDLISVLNNLFLNTPRINSNADSGFTYTNNHYIQTTINTDTNIVTFKSYKEYNLIQPIIDITPNIALDPNTSDSESEARSIYILTINHPNHEIVSAGVNILIQGAISPYGIPADSINTTQTVYKVIDKNTYQIQLKPYSFNLSRTRFDTKGGAAVVILKPDLFRMRFDQNDTMGSILGFRNPGNPESVFSFSNSISNNDPYAFESNTNSSGQQINITNNAVRLSGDDYIIMTANPLQTFTNVGPINKYGFAKIQLSDSPGKVLFNSYVSTVRFYDDPIHDLSSLDIGFYRPNGDLYDFNGLNNSFTIELITVSDIPDGTGIDATTGKNYNITSNTFGLGKNY
jgi:hypothetical protein